MDLYTLTLSLDASAGPTLREWLRTVFDGEAMPTSSSQEILLAVTEAVNNALRNGAAEGATVVVTLSIVGRDVYIRVTDRDSDSHSSSPTSAPEDGDAGAARGLGFTLMHGLMDEVDLQQTADGTTVRLVKRLRLPRSADAGSSPGYYPRLGRHSEIEENRQAI